MSAAKPMPCEDGACTNVNVVQRLSALEENTTQMRDDLRDIKTAIVGNKELQTKGLAQRVEAIESSDAEQNKKLFAWGAVITGVGAALGAVKDYFSK